jgi:hypothetical protein
MDRLDMSSTGIRVEDGEPALSPPPRLRHRETLIAIILLGAIGLFGLGDWYHQATRLHDYQAGTAAAAARHWAAAAAAFGAANGYADAAARAQDAAKQVAALESQYAQLEAATAAGDWLRAWHLAQDTARIQPDYRDIAARQDASYHALFGSGAAGLIYLQAKGPLPGLYQTVTDGAPVYLFGTGSTSQVRAVSPDGKRFLYDIDQGMLDSENQPCQPGAERLRPPDQPRLRLAVSSEHPDGQPARVLPASFDPAGPVWLSNQGAWAPTQDGRLQYYDFARTTTKLIPRPPGSQIAGVDGAHNRLLLATANTDTAGRQMTFLTLTSPDNPSMGSMAIIPGFLLNVTVAAGGDYATVLAEEVDTGIARTLYLLNLRPPGIATHVLDHMAWQGVQLAARLRATFLPGANPPQVLVERQDGQVDTVARYTLPAGPRVTLWAGADLYERPDLGGVSSDGQAFAVRTQAGNRPYLAWIPMQGDDQAQMLHIMALPNQQVDSWFDPRGGFVVYRMRNPAGLDQGTTESLFTVPNPLAPDAKPYFLGQARRVYDRTLPTFALPPGGSLAAFIDANAVLHVRTLDGAADTVLARDVEGLWALSP